MVIWNIFATSILIAALVNPNSMYTAGCEIQKTLYELADQVRIKQRSIISAFLHAVLITGRFLVLVTLILGNFIVIEFLGHEDKTARTTGEAINSAQKLSEPLPTSDLNAVVDSVKEKIDSPLIGNTSGDADVMRTQPETTSHNDFADTKVETIISEESKDYDFVNKSEDAGDSTTTVSESVPDHHEEKGNSDAHFVDAHDTTVPTATPGELTLELLQKKHNDQDSHGQQTDPDQNVLPEIDSRQRHNNNQIKRQSLLLPELVPQAPAASQSTELPRRQFSIMHKKTKSTEAKPKKLLSIFKKKN
ncbi:hypothetical protein INT43_007499 [Umbelopsis isabellina]|uniref:Uncharacterized protein n=1 Tax=Mortierella isabellina TaxID=91625 RepID=A0A8H7PYH4_MORIS|nr:hypothetical protein INT43_007499 [Umbelopsis isabellina]